MRINQHRRFRLIAWLLFGIAVFAAAFVLLISADPLFAAAPSSLRFGGAGDDDADRVRIIIEPNNPADIGSTDLTIEFWMKANAADNDPTLTVDPACSSATGVTGASGADWLKGNNLLSRYRLGAGQGWGVSIVKDTGSVRRIAFGLIDTTPAAFTYCSGAVNVLNGAWHHIAITRNKATGETKIFVDGVQSGPTGTFAAGVDFSYPDGVATGGCAGLPCTNDIFLVIGKEQHNVNDTNLPAYEGQLDELRFSKTIRYSGTVFSISGVEFVPDSNTLALYHFNEGSGTVTTNATGNTNSDGLLQQEPSFLNPSWVLEQPALTPTVSLTPSITLTPSLSPTASRTPTITLTPSLTLTASLTFTPSLTPTITRTPTATLTPTNTRPPTVTPSPTTFKPPQATAQALPTRDRGGTATAAAAAATATRAAIEATLATGQAAQDLTAAANITPTASRTPTLRPGAATFTPAPDQPAAEVGGGEATGGTSFLSGGRLVIAGIVGVVLLGLIILLLVLLLAPRPREEND